MPNSSTKFHEAQSKLRETKKKYDEANKLPIGGKATKMGEGMYGNRKAAEQAYDKVQNMREEEMEVQSERMVRAKRGDETNAETRRLMRENDEALGSERRDNKVR